VVMRNQGDYPTDAATQPICCKILVSYRQVRRHRDLLFCDPTYFNSSPTADPLTRASGFVQIAKALINRVMTGNAL
jgi:hypothetical protein